MSEEPEPDLSLSQPDPNHAFVYAEKLLISMPCQTVSHPASMIVDT
jgi:hypothetical protein